MRLVALRPSPGFRSLREQRDAASYAGACEANTEPVYEGPRAVSGNRSAGGRGGDGKIRVFECLEALH